MTACRRRIALTAVRLGRPETPSRLVPVAASWLGVGHDRRLTHNASVALVTPQSGSAKGLAAVVHALDKLEIDWDESELTLFVLAEGEDSVTLPPGDWHLMDGRSVQGGRVFSREDIGEVIVAFSAGWNSAAGT
jgi:hypothetical protein